MNGHPDLVGRDHKYACYAGQTQLILDDVQIQGAATDGQEPESWFGQVSFAPVTTCMRTAKTSVHA